MIDWLNQIVDHPYGIWIFILLIVIVASTQSLISKRRLKKMEQEILERSRTANERAVMALIDRATQFSDRYQMPLVTFVPDEHMHN